MTDDTLFQIGSIGNLHRHRHHAAVDQGNLQLDDPVRTHNPDEDVARWIQDRMLEHVNNPPEGTVQVGRLGRQCQLLGLMTDPRRTRRTLG